MSDEPRYNLDTKSWDKTCPCIRAEQQDPECPWHGRATQPDPDRFVHKYAEIVYELAKFGQYLRRQGGYVPARGIALRFQDVIRAALLEEDSDDALER